MDMTNRIAALTFRVVLQLAVFLVALSAFAGCAAPAAPVGISQTIAQAEDTDSGDEIIQRLYEEKKSDVAVSGKGTVLRLLSDDNEGDRHQRFILELQSGQTLLVAHNIDIAPRVDPLAAGDTVEFAGEYIYNDQGGIIHWTHHDPDGSHADGYIRANGQTYQ